MSSLVMGQNIGSVEKYIAFPWEKGWVKQKVKKSEAISRYN